MTAPRLVRRLLLQVVPKRYHLPLRYHYRRWRGTLDQEAALLKEIVNPGGTALDVGANVGVYTYLLWRLCVRVEAFEPIPEYADVIRAFGAPNIGVHQVALSSASGTRKLYFAREQGVTDLGRGSLSPPESREDLIEVPVRTLDEYELSNVSFMKLDVEGHELDVLKGAKRTVERWRPNLLVEIEQRHLSFPMTIVFDHLRDLGYRAHFPDCGRLRPIAEFSYERHQLPYLHDVYSPNYINNFVFLS